MIVTGEASGDLHGAKLIHACRKISPDISFYGVGGQRMAAAGCEILIPSEKLAVMGIVEVLGHFPVIYRAFQRLKKHLQGAQRPEALVLIDFPEFNLRLARQAKRARVPVLYYVSPQVWAWRRGRVGKIAQVVDRLAAIFPFEPELYRGLDIRVEYVGHPLLDEFSASEAQVNPAIFSSIPEKAPIVGLFPGSRQSELRYMLDTLVQTAEKIRARKADVHFVVPIALGLTRETISGKFPPDLKVTFVESRDADIYAVSRACDVVVSVSGTVTLQVALTGTPMTIFYKMSPVTYEIGRKLVKIEHVGLPNIVAGKEIVREFLQRDATADNLAGEAVRLLEDEQYAQNMRDKLGQMQRKLGEPGCSERVARMLSEMLTVTPEKLNA